MALKLANNASSTLAGTITAGATALSVQSADAGKFPSLATGDWHPLTVVDAAGNMEIMKVTARAGAVLTVERGQEGTAATSFSAGSRVDVRLTAGAIADFSTGAVRADIEQLFTPEQRTQARQNIAALEATAAAIHSVLSGIPALSDAKIIFSWDDGFALNVNETYFGSNWPININGNAGTATTATVATTANYAGSAGNASQLGGMPPSYYTSIEERFGYSIPRILSTQDARIYFGWAGGVLNLQVDGAAYFGANWPINITGTAPFAYDVPAAAVMNKIAAAVIATPGTRAFAVHVGSGAVTPGAVVAGSAIRWCSADGLPVTGDWLPGNWICEGHIANGATGIGRATGFKRYN